MRTRQHPTIEELQAALTQARAVADAERRRADRAEASARQAWRLAAWGGGRIVRAAASVDSDGVRTDNPGS